MRRFLKAGTLVVGSSSIRYHGRLLALTTATYVLFILVLTYFLVSS